MPGKNIFFGVLAFVCIQKLHSLGSNEIKMENQFTLTFNFNSMKEKASKLGSVKRSLFVLLLFAGISVQAFAQSVSGVVKDENREPLIGVSIAVKDHPEFGAVTDFDGNFTINNLPASAGVLKLSYIGMDSLEVKIAGRTNLGEIIMKADATEMEDLVVLGYGPAVERKSLTAAVGSASGDQLRERPTNNVAEALAGQIAGLNVTTTDGSPDAEIQLRIRGASSVTQNSEPLYILDGMPVSTISDIPASVIQSVDVLKDASATAIYGARGANGVVLITTKDPAVGEQDGCNKITVDYAGSIGWKWLAEELPLASAEDYVAWQYEKAMFDGKGGKDASKMKDYTNYYGNKGGSYSEVMDYYRNAGTTDWQDSIFGRTGQTINNSITISGGSKALSYSLNYSRLDDKAIMEGSNYTKDYLQFKLNAQPFKNFKLGFTGRYSGTKSVGSGSSENSKDSKSEGRMKQVLLYQPTDEYINEEAVEGADEAEKSALVRPDSMLINNYKENTKRTYSYNGYLSWQIIKGLTLRTEGAYDSKTDETYRYYGPKAYQARSNGIRNLVDDEIEMSQKYRNTNTLSFEKKRWKENHNFSAVIGEEMIVTKYRTIGSQVYNLPDNYGYEDALAFTVLGKAIYYNNRYPLSDNLLSFFGRANYDYKGRYLFSATLRADGSSKFAEGEQWGIFPAVSAAWRIADESFMKSTRSWLYDLKLRASIGTTGNNDIEAGLFQKIYKPTVKFRNGEAIQILSSGDVQPNPNLTWETSTTRDLGIDFGLFKNRLSGTIDVYWNTVDDMLIQYRAYGGAYKYICENAGSTSNKGVELTLNGVILNAKDYNLSANFNISYNKNEVESLGDGRSYLPANSSWGGGNQLDDYMVQVGAPLGQVWGFVSDGVYRYEDFVEGTVQTYDFTLNPGVITPYGAYKAMPGVLKLKDIAGTDAEGNKTDTPDGLIDSNDMTVIGNTLPKFTGGFNLSGRYKAFDISANFSFVYDVDVYNANAIELSQLQSKSFRNISANLAKGNRYSLFNEQGVMVQSADEYYALNANASEAMPMMNSQFVVHSDMIEDGSFLRLSSVTVGYTLPAKLIKKIYLSSARAYVSASNLFCLTKYSGADPEVSTRRSTPLTPGVDWSAYPKTRSFTIGLNLTF